MAIISEPICRLNVIRIKSPVLSFTELEGKKSATFQNNNKNKNSGQL